MTSSPARAWAVSGRLGRPFDPIDPPAEAWMVAGGVGLAPFVTLAEALKARGTTTRLFYGARRGSELSYVELFESLGVEAVLATEDGSRGARGFITAPLDTRTRRRPTYARGAAVCLWTDAHDAGRRPTRRIARPPMRCVARAGHGLRPWRVLQLRRAHAHAGRFAALRAILHRRTRVRRHPNPLGRARTLIMDLSVSIGALTLANPVIAASGCFGYGVEYSGRRRSLDAGRSGGQGVVPDRARGPRASAHCRNPRGHVERDRPARHRRASVRARKASRAARPAAVVIVNICGTTIDEYCRNRADPLRPRGRGRHRAEHLLPEHQAGRHHIRMQPDRAPTTWSARFEK